MASPSVHDDGGGAVGAVVGAVVADDDPATNFYKYANGCSYLECDSTKQSRDSPCERLRTETTLRLQSLLESHASPSLGAFWRSALDADGIEAAGIEPLAGVLDVIDRTAADRASGLAWLHRHGIHAFFAVGGGIQPTNSRRSRLQLRHGGYGLPHASLYHGSPTLVNEYADHVAHVLMMLGDGADAARESSRAIIQIEKALSSGDGGMPSLVRHRTRNNVSSWGGGRCSLVGCLSRSAACAAARARTAAGVSVPEEHLMFRHELRALSVVESEGFDWDTYLVHLFAPGSFKRRNTSPLDFCMSCLSLEDDDQDIRILVDNPRALAAAVRMLETVPVSHLRAYLRWHAVLSLTPYLPARFTAAHHDFFRIRVTGEASPEEPPPPRWRVVLEAMHNTHGEALGALYLNNHFVGISASATESSINHFSNMLRSEFQHRVGQAEWLSEEARLWAIRKLEALRVVVGARSGALNNSDAREPEDDKEMVQGGSIAHRGAVHLHNALRSRLVQHEKVMQCVNSGEAPRSSGWAMHPHDVNAYYDVERNCVVLPAAFLQPPFYCSARPIAWNLGRIGALIAHEMAHAFDGTGRYHDASGSMQHDAADPWEPEDAGELFARLAALAAQASDCEINGHMLDGTQCRDEIMADMIGLSVAHSALINMLSEQGVSDDAKQAASRVFFLSWGQLWQDECSLTRREYLCKTDTHAPGEYRVNMPLSQMPEYHAAFAVQPGQPMWCPHNDRVKLW